MAEITLDALALSASASINGLSKRIFTSNSAINGQADVSGRIVLIVKDKSTASGDASFANVFPNIIKYVRKALTNNSNAIATPFKYKTIRASLVGESTLNAFTYHRDINADMHTYLPPHYNDLEDVQIMLDAEASEIVRIQARLYEVLDQFYVNSATYGLDRWESEVGIDKIPQRSTDSRRHYINAKLRGTGTVSESLLKSVVDSFYFAEITDIPNEHQVNVKLLGKRGEPRNLEDIDVAVTDIIPAHLQPNYEFTFATWGEINNAQLTWKDADDKTMEELEETFYIDPGYPHQN